MTHVLHLSHVNINVFVRHVCSRLKRRGAGVLSVAHLYGPSSVLNEIELACVIVLRLVTAITDYGTSCAFIDSVQHGFYSLFVFNHIRTYKACAAIAELLNRW